MRNEQDIINLRAQYREELEWIRARQKEFSDHFGFNKGIISSFEVPLIKVLELEIDRLSWILGEHRRYPGPTYREVSPDLSFMEFVKSRWQLDYNASYHYCHVHGTFEKDDTCVRCVFDYQEAIPIISVAPALEVEQSNAS